MYIITYSLSIHYRYIFEKVVRDFVELYKSNYSQSDEFLDTELDLSENSLNTNIVQLIIIGKILGSTVVKKFSID